ncbi:hypothetical protein [Jatrophihabitans fulvus]
MIDMSLTMPERRIEVPAPNPVDMRCSTGLLTPTGSAPGAGGRCQLLAGHHGAHAVMYADGRERAVLAWHGNDEPTRFTDGWQQLPWMRGYPVPAWYEGPADLDHVTAAAARL